MDAADNAYKIVEKYTNSAIYFIQINMGHEFLRTPQGAELVSVMVKSASDNFRVATIGTYLNNFTESINKISKTLDRRI